MSGWRVWRAFESDRPRIDGADLWRALVEACRRADGHLDWTEFETWMEILLTYRRGEA